MTGDDSPDPLAALMARYQGGDASALEEIYRRTAASVEAYMRRWSGAAGASDLAQEVFLQVIRARRSFRPELPFRPWLFAIAHHVGLGSMRTRRRKLAREVQVEELPEVQAPAATGDPIERDRLEKALLSLPEGQREVVWLGRVEGMTSKEIARVMGLTQVAVKVRLHRAEGKLRSLLGGGVAGAGSRGVAR